MFVVLSYQITGYWYQIIAKLRSAEDLNQELI